MGACDRIARISFNSHRCGLEAIVNYTLTGMLDITDYVGPSPAGNRMKGKRCSAVNRGQTDPQWYLEANYHARGAHQHRRSA